ncbi:hypothetical protein BX666DRAFT_1917408 [Dichotomocladium elegans]|nr:hypothetical protein BX666DRAFT_1917408 [Dichotomocladium elegans]
MGIFTEEVQKTSITFYIERLSNYEEIDWYIVQQLTESIQMQGSGPHEAVEAIRKRLKHGTTDQKLRVIEVLKLLMENTNERFRRQVLANDKMKERFELIIASSIEDIRVRKALVSCLGAVATKYKSEPGMFVLAELYESGRTRLGGKPMAAARSKPGASPPQPSSPRTPGPPASPPSSSPAPVPAEPPMPPRPQPQKRLSLPPGPRKQDIKTKPRSSSTAGSSSNNHPSGGPRREFNFESAKPKIIQEVALANQHSNNLINALKLINTNEERWEIDLQHDARLQDYRQRCEDSKKKIVRYARLVEDEEWIGTLLATNEELLKALQMYELMSVGEVPQNMPSPIGGGSPVPASPTTARSPPPPPPPAASSYYEDTLSHQMGHVSLSKYNEDDPFADPVTPLEDLPSDQKRLG